MPQPVLCVSATTPSTFGYSSKRFRKWSAIIFATVARQIARHFENRLDAYPNVDGVVALTHKSGCGMASDGEAIDVLRRTMAGYARHPNFFAVQVVGLGCEANQISGLMRAEGLEPSQFLHTMTIQ